ncbi:hypothetical protein TVAG_145390 [Trichomonas vaginalis G3]|uniref:Uncharacterized protein n=1 Tax=Trichomonas vaginalis (strain ATCC PRA-98 / G3) TaxID=412133 RepID=A2EUM1_TRIV3|nr:hypothetical protein TVAGG3_0547390 [Trichomonas vaginalis G3]EAY03670.1 hypothetical protein TVAG_145390 [Trichomonas vaginalis G3]KAI5520276.1 hypothetical protein TVAGG3_0547390 [Trichomonas vaginalis G3]|eukprot:XP_001315893.1 hypothetical protein [Trichomonas vaginalis G3]
MPSLNGREAPEHGTVTKTQQKTLIETKPFPFETEQLKVIKPVIPPRPQSYLIDAGMERTKQDDGTFAVRLSNSTWAHSQPNVNDHYATRDEALAVIQNYDEQVRLIAGGNEVDRANQLQSVTDMLLDQLSDQLRAECIERCEIVEKARNSYAAIFTLLQDDGQKCREKIRDLEEHNKNIEENLTKVIDTSTERVNDAREDCARQIAEIKQEMEANKEEYDSSMKRFLEQKAQLEEHVKALHRVFIEFQSDSVYMTLEELKQKHESLERKMQNKESEISKLKVQLTKLQKQVKEVEDQKALLEQANTQLRRDLADAISTKYRLQTKLNLQNIESGMPDEQIEEEELVKPAEVPQTPSGTISPDEHTPQRQKRKVRTNVDPNPYIRVNQKLSRAFDAIAEVFARANNPISPNPNEQQINEELDSLLLSCDYSLMIRAIEKRADELIHITEQFDTLNLSMIGGDGNLSVRPMTSQDPRFIQYIRTHNSEQGDSRSNINVFSTIRQLFQAKYTSDKWRERLGQKPQRFPEFMIEYFCKDGDTIFASLQRAARVYRIASKSNSPEAKLFVKFLLESYTVDEMTFFNEIRYALVGLPNVPQDAPAILNVPYAKCKELLERVVGVFSPALAGIMADAQKLAISDYIDYAAFITILMKYYRGERRKRRNAVKLMFNSKKFKANSNSVDFEAFVGMVQSLGFTGPFDDVFDMYRVATLLGGGSISIDSLLSAMDDLSIHFYSIETPFTNNTKDQITEMPRKDITRHWTKFSKWFEKMKDQTNNTFEPWIKYTITKKVFTVDDAFKANKSVDNLVCEYRGLLDFYQYSLDIMIRGLQKPLPSDKTERLLALFENLVDLYLTFYLQQKETVISPDMTEVA